MCLSLNCPDLTAQMKQPQEIDAATMKLAAINRIDDTHDQHSPFHFSNDMNDDLSTVNVMIVIELNGINIALTSRA